jgi:hypothetical protein
LRNSSRLAIYILSSSSLTPNFHRSRNSDENLSEPRLRRRRSLCALRDKCRGDFGQCMQSGALCTDPNCAIWIRRVRIHLSLSRALPPPTPSVAARQIAHLPLAPPTPNFLPTLAASWWLAFTPLALRSHLPLQPRLQRTRRTLEAPSPYVVWLYSPLFLCNFNFCSPPSRQVSTQASYVCFPAPSSSSELSESPCRPLRILPSLRVLILVGQSRWVIRFPIVERETHSLAACCRS